MAGHFHDDSIADVASALRSDPESGITLEEARARLARLGPNLVAEEEGPSRWGILRAQFMSPVVGVLLAAAVLSLVLREWVDFAVILAIVVLNAAVGFYQEFRAERALAALRGLAAPKARVMRGGASSSVSASDLVPGDLIELEAGDRIPADARLVSVVALRTNESALTGESMPVDKSTSASAAASVGLGDRLSCTYLGTTVVGGRGRALVFGTGADTELGKIATLVRKAEREPTPLQRDLAQMGKTLLLVCGVAILAVFLAGVMRWASSVDAYGRVTVSEMFLTGVSLAVAAIPEGLPAIVTITLAIGVQRMLKRHVLLRRLPAVETLGCASVVCTDKTGTITKNEMAVRGLLVGDAREVELAAAMHAPDERIADLLGAAAACSNARDAGGDPTELALVTAAHAAGWTNAELDRRFPRIAEVPFDSDRRRMSTLHSSASDGHGVLFVKGAPEVVLSRCTRVRGAGGDAPLDAPALARIDDAARRFADRGMRVLAVASARVAAAAGNGDPASLERDLTCLGLVAMADPPRNEAAQAVARSRAAGVRTVLITGDHVGTATAVAREVGIFRPGDRVVTGPELALMSDDELTREVERIDVYARVVSEQKLKIIAAWKRRGAVVAMTGDGVNDAPAIRAADVGVAMGRAGTDVAREAADIVVLDDNYASIVAAIEEGRGIYANIRRAVLCLFAGNLSEVALVGAATALGLPVPLNPTQILWMNLVTDGPPALALATEPVAPDAMRKPPRDRRARLLDGPMIVNLVYQGFVLYLAAMLALLYFYEGGKGGPDAASLRMRTGVFCTVVVSQMLNCFSFRNDERSIFQMGLFGNVRLLLAVVVSIALQVFIVHWGAVRPIFKTTTLSAEDWIAVALFSLLPVTLVEIRKAFLRKRAV